MLDLPRQILGPKAVFTGHRDTLPGAYTKETCLAMIFEVSPPPDNI